MTWKRETQVKLTYIMQGLAAALGLACLVLIVFSLGRLSLVPIQVLLLLVNGWIFAFQFVIRARLKRSMLR